MIDPLTLVKAARERHGIYHPLRTGQTDLLGPSYAPNTQVGRTPIDNPVGDAAARGAGVAPSNAQALADQYKPPSPLNPVEPHPAGLSMRGFADGGAVEYGTSDLAKEIAATPPNPPIITGEDQDTTKGGSTEHEDGDGVSGSSLRWIADMARKFGVKSMAEDRARLATGIAKQFYGLDEHGNPVLGGQAWLSSQHGTPPRILDQLAALPADLAPIGTMLLRYGGKNINPNVTFNAPDWSKQAQQRLDQLDKRVKETTGVGDAHTLPEHIEDAAAMLATPLPAAKVAGEAPAAQRLLEFLTPVRPPTVGRYATDATAIGGLSASLDALARRLAERHTSQPTQEGQ